MSKYVFKPVQRAAIFVTHGEKCYMCNTPLDLLTMEIDHVIPESLESDPARLAMVLRTLGRPKNFALNSYFNWMPACRPCNRKKQDMVFDPSLAVQLALQTAAAKAADVEQRTLKAIRKKDVANALNVLLQANANGVLTESDKKQLEPLASLLLEQRQPEAAAEPLRLTPLYVVLSDHGPMQIIQGPHGVGNRPKGKHVDPTWDCPNCGNIAAWNGARCVICGQLNDE